MEKLDLNSPELDESSRNPICFIYKCANSYCSTDIHPAPGTTYHKTKERGGRNKQILRNKKTRY